MQLNLALTGVLSIIVGLLVLIFPGLLRIGLGLYLILVGLISFFNF